MWVGRRLLSLLAIVVGSTLTFCAAQGINEECTLLSGGPGVCRKITECPEVAQFAHRREVKYCGTVGRVAIVCCPADSSSCSSAGDNGGIAAPAVNFECGLQATRTIPHPGGLPSRRRRRSLAGQSIGIGASVFAGLVLGGITSRVSAWPWMALLDVVRLGEHDYDDPSETTHEDYAISQTVVYPHYVPEQAYHDLALIKLDRKVQIKDFIRPVCLPWNQRNPSRLVNSGVTIPPVTRVAGGRRSSTLQEVELKVFPSSRCHVQYKELVFFNRVWPSGIAGETMCAGTTTGGKDACQGDSGGPAVHHECKRYTLAGVISKGYDCGLRDFAGLYVNVRQRFYLQWIKETAF
ncbi:serine proteinase [Penaeus vannamei]|uniref:Serine proteinase n=1 Tax=Penaeus vannamei TaxID=6689 RepID=A0A3R7PL65_PENVA|nr:serine proteinase [Penaeus vannamei]